MLSGLVLTVSFGAHTVHTGGALYATQSALRESRTVLVPASADGGSEWG